jgi:hypothetical protein
MIVPGQEPEPGALRSAREGRDAQSPRLDEHQELAGQRHRLFAIRDPALRLTTAWTDQQQRGEEPKHTQPRCRFGGRSGIAGREPDAPGLDEAQASGGARSMPGRSCIRARGEASSSLPPSMQLDTRAVARDRRCPRFSYRLLAALSAGAQPRSRRRRCLRCYARRRIARCRRWRRGPGEAPGAARLAGNRDAVSVG